MKMKIDYVTNSSSSSYLLYIESKHDNIEDFRISLDTWIENWLSYTPSSKRVRFYNPSDIKQISSNTFLVTEWTPMHNDFDDIPGYMRDLIFSMITDRDFLEEMYGFINFKFEIHEDM